MTKPPERRRPSDPMKAAEALFRPAAPKLPEPSAKAPAVPGAKETVTLRLDQDVLAVFQEDGPGWQDRINAALRKLVEDRRG
ncbi:MAG: BrnA antitoxin family protein [Bauldia sp.]